MWKDNASTSSIFCDNFGYKGLMWTTVLEIGPVFSRYFP